MLVQNVSRSVGSRREAVGNVFGVIVHKVRGGMSENEHEWPGILRELPVNPALVHRFFLPLVRDIIVVEDKFCTLVGEGICQLLLAGRAIYWHTGGNGGAISIKEGGIGLVKTILVISPYDIQRDTRACGIIMDGGDCVLPVIELARVIILHRGRVGEDPPVDQIADIQGKVRLLCGNCRCNRVKRRADPGGRVCRRVRRVPEDHKFPGP